MNNPKISIIIPVYNSEKYIDKCITSLIKQSLDDFEVIIVNDGSTDKSLDILTKYSINDSRIKVYTQENKGPGSARNNGIKRSNGEYILFLDSDDWLEEDALKKLYDTAINNQADIVLFNAVEHRPNNQYHNRIYNINGNVDYESFSFDYTYNKDLVMNSYLIACTKLHKIDFIKENNIKFAQTGLFEDVYFHIKTMIRAKRISYNPEIFYNYRRTDINSRQNNSITSRHSMSIFNIFRQVEKLLIEDNIMNDLEVNFIRFKITELENIFNNINTNDKEDLYIQIKNDFNKMKLNSDVLNILPMRNKNFYNNIINSESLLIYEENIVNKKRSFSRIKSIQKHILEKLKSKKL